MSRSALATFALGLRLGLLLIAAAALICARRPGP
jgi:hypothetical protein